jgi:hypothetical protein
MQTWFSRLAIALLAVSLMQAGVAACCRTLEDLNGGARQHCHHAPRSSHVACAPAYAVKGVAAQSITSRDRLRVAGPVLVNAQMATSPVSLLTAAIDTREADPSPPDDLFLRIHVLLI